MLLNIRITSTTPVCKKQPNSYVGVKKKYITVNKARNKIRKDYVAVIKKDNKKISKPKPASSQKREVYYSVGESTPKMASTSNILSKSNMVNKESNERRKGACDVSKKDNKKKYARYRPSSSQTYEFSSSYSGYIVPEVSENGYDNDLDEEDQDRDTDDSEIGAHYKKPFFTNAENKSCPNGWIDVNDLQPNEDVLGRYQQPHLNPNKVRFVVKMFIPLSHWSDYVECVWWPDESCHSSIKLINLDMTLASMLLVGKVIGRVKKGVYDIALLSHVNDDEVNEMSLFDVRIFAVKKETYLITIYNNSHPCTDSIKSDSSLDGNYQGVSYGLYDTTNNDSDFEDMEKT